MESDSKIKVFYNVVLEEVVQWMRIHFNRMKIIDISASPPEQRTVKQLVSLKHFWQFRFFEIKYIPDVSGYALHVADAEAAGGFLKSAGYRAHIKCLESIPAEETVLLIQRGKTAELNRGAYECVIAQSKGQTEAPVFFYNGKHCNTGVW